jgi:predicted MFS family arabinose efflux permease
MPHLQPMTNAAKLGMLFAASIAIAIGGTHSHVLGAMVKPLSDAYGWSRGDITFALTISSIISPFSNVAVGLLADRYPARRIALIGIVFFALGTASLGLVTKDIWTWYLAYSVFTIAGTGISAILFTKLVVQHFTKRRGIALATSLAGAGILVSTIPHIVLALEGIAGVKGVYPMIAVLSFVLLIVPCWLFLPRNEQVAVATLGSVGKGGSWRAVIGSPILWRMTVSFLLVSGCIGTFIVHLQPMLTDAGLSRSDAATVALFVGPAMIVGRMGTGMLFDILPTKLVTGIAFTLPALACAWLLLLPLDFTSASALAVLIGLTMGSEVDAIAYLASRYFGTARYGLVFAILISVYGFGIGLASWLVALAFDANGNYDSVLVLLLAGVGVAMASMLSMAPPPELEAEHG